MKTFESKFNHNRFAELCASAKSAKTKYDMCWHMDYFNWRNLPWLQMVNVFDKAYLRAQYDVFLFNLLDK